MRQLEGLVQGSDAWLEARSKYHTASEASALMGVGYISRSELMRLKATGDKQEHSQEVVNGIFARGHEIEALARPLAEAFIGEELFLVTGVCDADYLLASFDGLTMDETICWECKTANKNKVESIKQNIIPDIDYWQVVQQLIVSGAEKALYTISDGTPEDTAHIWLASRDCKDDQKKLLAAWSQFDADLANYVHTEVAPTPIGRAPDNLPALMIEVKGAVLASNLDAFKAHALSVFSGINRSLSTDVDFANAEKTVKWCGEVEKKLELAKEQALAQTADIDLLFRTIDQVREEARTVRLELEKLVKARKESVRGEILTSVQSALRKHIQDVIDGFPAGVRLPQVNADFAAAMKGKKTVTSLNDAVAGELARVKVEISRLATGIHASIKVLHAEQEGFESLFPDWPTLVLKDAEDLRLLVRARITEHKAEQQKKLDAERERMRLEEEQKARDKIALEAKQQADEAARIAREDERKRNTEAMKQAQVDAKQQEPEGSPVPPPVQVTESAPAQAHGVQGLYIPEASFEEALAKWARAHCITDTALQHLKSILQVYGIIEETEAA